MRHQVIFGLVCAAGLLVGSTRAWSASAPINYVTPEKDASWVRNPADGDYGGRVVDAEIADKKILELHSNTDSISPVWKIENLEFKADQVYAFSVRAKAPVGSAYRVYVENSVQGSWENFGTSVEGTGQWQVTRKEFSFKSNTSVAAFVISLGGPGQMVISDATLEEVSGKTRKELEAEQSVHGKPVPIANGDFEKGDEKWTLTESSRIETDPEAGSNHVLALSVPESQKTTKVVHRRIPVSPATNYVISYRVRGIKGKGDENAFHWFRVYPDSGAATPGELLSYQSSFDQWQNKTVQFRSNARQTDIVIAVEARGPAEILVDDLKMESVPEKETAASVRLDFPYSYRDGVFASHPEKDISGVVTFDSSKVSKVVLNYRDASGKTVDTRTLASGDKEASFTFPSPPEGQKYVIEMVASDAQGRVVEQQALPITAFAKNASEVVFNKNKVTLVNGKRFFPIGHTQTTYRGTLEAELKFFKEAGFNTLLMDGTTKTLDVFQEHGMMMIKQVPASIASSGTPEQNANLRQVFTDEVARMSPHPALLCYFGADEPAWAGAPLSSMAEIYNIIRNTDPYHPVYVNEAPVVLSPQALRTYSSVADVYGMDIYPVPEGSMHGSLDTNRTLSCVGTYVDICRDIVEDRKPIWMILQSFAWSQCHDPFLPPEKAVYPTWEQSRFMAYQSIAHGATGIIYHYLPYGRVLSEQFWRDLRKVTIELQYVSPILVEDSVVPSAVQCENAQIRILQKKHEGQDYYIIVNENAKEQDIVLTGFSADASKLNVLLEDSRTLAPSNGKLELKIPGYGVVVASTAKFQPVKEIYHDETYTPYNIGSEPLGGK